MRHGDFSCEDTGEGLDSPNPQGARGGGEPNRLVYTGRVGGVFEL